MSQEHLPPDEAVFLTENDSRRSARKRYLTPRWRLDRQVTLALVSLAAAGGWYNSVHKGRGGPVVVQAAESARGEIAAA